MMCCPSSSSTRATSSAKASTMRSAANGGSSRRACAGNCWKPSARRPSRPASSAFARLQHRRQRGLLRLPRQPVARPALVGGARLPQAGAAPAEPAARNRLPGRGHPVRRQARASGCDGGRTACRAAHAAARSSSRPGRSARCRSCCCRGSGRRRSSGARHSGRARQAGRRREPAGSPAAAAHLQGLRQSRRSTRPITRGSAASACCSTTRCAGAAR